MKYLSISLQFETQHKSSRPQRQGLPRRQQLPYEAKHCPPTMALLCNAAVIGALSPQLRMVFREDVEPLGERAQLVKVSLGLDL